MAAHADGRLDPRALLWAAADVRREPGVGRIRLRLRLAALVATCRLGGLGARRDPVDRAGVALRLDPRRLSFGDDTAGAGFARRSRPPGNRLPHAPPARESPAAAHRSPRPARGPLRGRLGPGGAPRRPNSPRCGRSGASPLDGLANLAWPGAGGDALPWIREHRERRCLP